MSEAIIKRKFRFVIAGIILGTLIHLIVPAISQAVDLKITWSPVYASIPIGYRVYFREAGESYDFRYPIWEGEETDCTIHSLEEGGSYHMVLRAHDFNGNESGNSSEITYNLGVATVSESTGTGSDGGGGGGGCFIQSAASGASHQPWRRFTGTLWQYLQVICSFVLD